MDHRNPCGQYAKDLAVKETFGGGWMIAGAISLACNALVSHSLDGVVYSWKTNLFMEELFCLYQTLVTLMCNGDSFVTKSCRYNYVSITKNDIGLIIDCQFVLILLELIQFYMVSFLKLFGMFSNVSPRLRAYEIG